MTRESMRPDAAIGRLQESLDNGAGLCLLIGAGLTINATGDPHNSWPELIIRGAIAAERYRDRAWVDRVKADVETGRTADMLAAAEKVTDALGDQFPRWLQETVGSLEATNFTLLDQIKRLAKHKRVPIVTTNYDGLLHRHMGFERVTWRQEKSRLMDAYTRWLDAVVHIHGYWVEHSTVVFGSRSYQSLQANGIALEGFEKVLLANTVLTVGVGAGIADPTFQVILGWAEKALDGARSIFYLHKDGDPAPVHPRIIPVPLPSHDDLAEFLGQLEVKPVRPLEGYGNSVESSFSASDLQSVCDLAASPRNNRTTKRARQFIDVYGAHLDNILAGSITPAARAQVWTDRLMTTWLTLERARENDAG